MKIVTVIGARPQFIKAAAVSRVLRKKLDEYVIHTGQHYDVDLSDIFFQDLAMATPDAFLNIGSGSHGVQTAGILAALEPLLLNEQPDLVLLYGDTNSTIAGALAASKLHIPIAHVEAGLRSFNRRMPEEINRIVTDHLSTLLFCPSQTSVDNLRAEGIQSNVYAVGDVMHDVLKDTLAIARTKSRILDTLGVASREYVLATVHRAENTDDRSRLLEILNALGRSEVPVILPLHPRTRAVLSALKYDVRGAGMLKLVGPLGYFDMVLLESEALGIATDSGGIQKEAYWLGVPCITMRDETEWIETIDAGSNVLVGSNGVRIEAEIKRLPQRTGSMPDPDLLFGDANSAERCVEKLHDYLL